MARSTAARATSPGRASASGTGTQIEDPRAETEAELGGDEVRGCVEVRDGIGCGDPRRARVEAGEVGLADGHDRHAARLEVLQGRRHVQDGLGPGADDGHGRAAELLEVGRDVECGCAPVPPDAGAAPPRAPWWTPPIPPVAKTEIPAAWAAIIVAETVVAAQPPPASAAARLGRAALRTEPAGAVARAVRAASSRPTRKRPALIATVAGTAPAARTAASDALATSMFCGYGRPWLISVDSRATTGLPSARAAGDFRGDRRGGQIGVVWVRTAEAYSRGCTGRAPLRPRI